MYKKVFKPAITEALPSRLHAFRFHDLGHTSAAWLIAAGAHRLQIKLRGHNEIRTTMDTCGHVFLSAEPRLAALLGAGYGENQKRPNPWAFSTRTAGIEPATFGSGDRRSIP
jgi:hypothetical protein